jgi:tetratricopeptide (TPR) repeat protein
MQFHPPRMEGIPEDQFEIYKDVVNGAYRFHDMMLETLVELAGPDATVILVSDHGFHSDHLRPRGIPREPAGPAVQHRNFGMVAMRGTHIKQDERIYGATLLDITPTILTLFGLPVGADMDGRVLVQAFEEPPEVSRIASWEQEPGDCGMHPADLRTDPVAAQAVLQRFVALGYMQAPDEDQEKAVETAVREQYYNLARAYLDANRHRDALPLLQELVSKWPDDARFSQYLAQCYLAMRNGAEAKAILEQLISKPLKSDARDAAEVPGSEAVAQQEVPMQRPWADLLMGMIHFEEGNLDEALACLLQAERSDPRLPDLHLRIGDVYLRQRRFTDAERAYELTLQIDGDNPAAHLGLAIVYLRKRRNDLAAERALHAVGLQHFLPQGHFYLGVALARLGYRERAVLAFETSLIMVPGLMAAHRWLANLYRQPGGDPEKSASHNSIYLQMRQRQKTKAQG